MEQINKRNYQVGQIYTATGKTTGEMKFPNENKLFNPMYQNERTLQQIGIHVRSGLIKLQLEPTDNLIDNLDMLFAELLVLKKATNNIASILKERGYL